MDHSHEKPFRKADLINAEIEAEKANLNFESIKAQLDNLIQKFKEIDTSNLLDNDPLNSKEGLSLDNEIGRLSHAAHIEFSDHDYFSEIARDMQNKFDDYKDNFAKNFKEKSSKQPFTKEYLNDQKKLLKNIRPLVQKSKEQNEIQQENSTEKNQNEIDPFTNETLKDAKQELKNDKDKLMRLQPTQILTMRGPRMDMTTFMASKDKYENQIKNRGKSIDHMETVFEKNSIDFNTEFKEKGVGYSPYAIKEIERDIEYKEEKFEEYGDNLKNEFQEKSQGVDLSKDTSYDLDPDI